MRIESWVTAELMKLLGLTGGIGMGKSTAAGILSELGVRVADTDVIAREMVEPGQPALAEIKTCFGEGVVDDHGRLRREELARLVFADANARRDLEMILHPRIREIWLARVREWRRTDVKIGVVVIPLLFETRAEHQCENVACAACTSSTQMQRLLARGWSSDEVERRNAAQWPVERKMAASRFVVWTEGVIEVHRRQWQRILEVL